MDVLPKAVWYNEPEAVTVALCVQTSCILRLSSSLQCLHNLPWCKAEVHLHCQFWAEVGLDDWYKKTSTVSEVWWWRKQKEAAIYKDHFTLYDFEKLLKKNEKGINKSLENWWSFSLQTKGLVVKMKKNNCLVNICCFFLFLLSG